MKLKLILLLLFVMGFSAQLTAQVKKTSQDSTQLYKKIEQYSEKSSFTKSIHKLLFRSTDSKPRRVAKNQEKQSYEVFEGKIIRKIIIDTKDPFGFSFSDSTKTAKSWLEKTGNSIHIKSKNLAISNFLLLKENEPLDTLLISESARLLRAQNYIREIRISPQFVSEAKDSVDVIITSLDSWSLIPSGELSSSQTKVKIKERNVIGMGHQIKLGYKKRHDDGSEAYEASYSMPNLMSTFISASGSYSTDYDGYFEKTIAVDRPFYSPLTRWAGGLFLQEKYLGVSLQNDTMAFVIQKVRFITQDYWAGHAFRIFKGNSERERTTNLIVSARSLFVDYRESPKIEYDSIGFFSNENFYLGSVGIASRQFLEDSYIYLDGITEDVPIGIVLSITAGVQHKNHLNRLYLGAKASYGNYFNWGFLSFDLEAGSFFKKQKTEQTTYSFEIDYFSKLWSLGRKWKMRQFIKPQVVIGVNRLNTIADRVSLNEYPNFTGANGNLYFDQRNGSIPGFNGEEVGTSKYVFATQTQFYSPWELLGFRFNPFLSLNAAILVDHQSGSNNFYSSFGLGAIIRNDYLVFDAFQFSLMYYPQIPGQGTNIFKTNAFKNEDFGFQDFQIEKPQTVIYN